MALTREERLARAREKAKKFREKSKTRGKYADRMDWRPKAKIYLHPETEIEDRYRVWFPKVVEKQTDDPEGKQNRRKKTGKKAASVRNVPFNVDQDPKRDPFACFRKALREAEDVDGDDVVLVVGTGRDKIELCKGEILGWEGYDYKKRLTVSKDVVFAALKIADAKGARPDELKWEVLTAPKSLGNEITKEMESEMDESGEEDGNPFFNPYPFIIEFDESERGSDMYSARARPQEKPDSEIAKKLEEDCPDIASEIEVDDVDEILKLIKAALVIELEFEVEGVGKKKSSDDDAPRRRRREEPADEKEDDEEDDAPRRRRRRRREEPADEKEEPANESDDENDDESDDEPPKSKRRRSKPAPEPAPEPEPEPEPEAPKATRKKKTVKKDEEKKPAWEPAEGEDYDICPACNGKVAQDATECPHCGAAFEVGDDGDPF